MKRNLILSTLAAVAAVVTLSLAASCAKVEGDPETPENSEEKSFFLRYTAYEETVPYDWSGLRHGFDAATGEGWIELPYEVTEIPKEAYTCSGLTSIEVPASIMSIGDYAFYLCDNLEIIAFADGSQLNTIGARAFWGAGLKSIELPASITEIKEEAFESCDDLASVTFAAGSQLKIIGEEVFLCSGLKSIEIPASVIEIKKSAFEACYYLEYVSFAVGTKLKFIREQAFANSGLKTIKIPESVKYIGEGAFCLNDYLETVIFLSSVPPIHDEDVFRWCWSLGAIYVPDGSMNTYCANWSDVANLIFEESLRHKEINVTVSELTDNTAVVNCIFTPAKSSTYKVHIGETISEEFSESVRLRISNLKPGENHRVTATVFDANQNRIGAEDIDFMTTGIPTGTVREVAVIERINDPLIVTLTVSSDSNGKVWIGDEESVTSGQFQFGQQVVIHAVPNDGFIFLKWNDDNLEQNRIVTAGTTDTEYSAIFVSLDSVSKCFTVNSRGKKVFFSKGSLWADSSNELHFENKQWEYCGRYNRDHVSHFTWSSAVSDAAGMKGTGGYLFCDEDHKQSVDGSEAIYYALSIEEWEYLFDTHDCRWAEVNGVGGYLIAPDGVTLPAAKVGFIENDLIVDNLVFLPSMGLRGESSIFYDDFVGLYWSSTEFEVYPDVASYGMYFDSGEVYYAEYCQYEMGGSIRLVSDVR